MNIAPLLALAAALSTSLRAEAWIPVAAATPLPCAVPETNGRTDFKALAEQTYARSGRGGRGVGHPCFGHTGLQFSGVPKSVAIVPIVNWTGYSRLSVRLADPLLVDLYRTGKSADLVTVNAVLGFAAAPADLARLEAYLKGKIARGEPISLVGELGLAGGDAGIDVLVETATLDGKPLAAY